MLGPLASSETGPCRASGVLRFWRRVQNAASVQGDGTRNELALYSPLRPAHRPHGRHGKKRVLMPGCCEAVIENDSGRQKGAPPGLTFRRAKKGSALFDAWLAPRRSPGCAQQGVPNPIGLRRARLVDYVCNQPFLVRAKPRAEDTAKCLLSRQSRSAHFLLRCCHATCC